MCRPGATAPEMAEACAAASRSGLIGALTLCVLAYAVAAIFYALASRTLREDLKPRADAIAMNRAMRGPRSSSLEPMHCAGERWLWPAMYSIGG